MLCVIRAVAYTTEPASGWLAKPFYPVDGHHHLTSSHKKKEAAERRAASGGRGGCRHTRCKQARKRHSPSALLFCDTLAQNAEFSLTGWRWTFALSFTFMAGFVADAGPRCRWVSTLRFSPRLVFQQSVFFFFFFSRMSHAIGSHLLLMHSLVVGQITASSGTRMSLSGLYTCYPKTFI